MTGKIMVGSAALRSENHKAPPSLRPWEFRVEGLGDEDKTPGTTDCKRLVAV